MSPEEFSRLRQEVIVSSQKSVAQEMVSPSSGGRVSESTVSRWESGKVDIPLWAARRMDQLAKLARSLDEAAGLERASKS